MPVARFEIVQFERIVFLAQDGFELTRTPEPHVLFARIARHIRDFVLLEHVINEPRAIHSAISGISRAIFVIEIARGQFERRSEELLDFERIILEPLDLVWHQGRVRRMQFC